MTIKLAWEYPDHSAIRIWYDDNWAWDEFYEAMAEAKAMAEFADRSITIIHDLRHVEHIPQNPTLHYRNWAIEMQAYSYVNIVISNNPKAVNLFQMFKHVAGHWGDGFILAENMSDAHYIAVGETLEFERLA